MVWTTLSAAVLVVAAGMGAAQAQSASELRDPRELPPASFTGQQYVDSGGCVFLRAGLDGRVNWVPRVTASRKQLCGYPPTFAPQRIDIAGTAPAPDRQVAIRPAAEAPVATKHRARPTMATAPARQPDRQPARALRVEIPQTGDFTPPKGYKAAFRDDRLNPKRGIGTAEGWAAQDRVWTREVPARLVATVRPAPAKGKLHLSSKAPPAAGSERFVQAAALRDASGADRAANRLKRLGLPVARARLARSGTVLQLVLVGPFATTAEAQKALLQTRKAGFGDAYIR